MNLLDGLKPDGALIANYTDGKANLQKALGSEKNIYAVNANKIAVETIGKPMANTAMLGALVKVSGIVKLNSIEEELRTRLGGKLSPKVIEMNILSVQRAYSEVE